MSESTRTIELTEAELEVVRNAFRTYLSDFTHDDADLVAEIRKVQAKFAAAPTGPVPQATG